jgi:hypothetical protein
MRRESLNQGGFTAEQWQHEEVALAQGKFPNAPFECFYDSDRKEYLFENAEGRWLPLPATGIKRRLKMSGLPTRPLPGEFVSRCDQFLAFVEDHHDVRYAAPLAGRTAGFYEENGIRFLVTESPKLIEPKAGKFNNIMAVIRGLYHDSEPAHGQRQLDTYLGYVKTAVESLRAGRSQQAQALATAGPPGCGKSLSQHLFTHMLGGRSAKAAQFMTGQTTFNADLFEAEHLMLEDEFMSSRITDRHKLAAAIKNATVSTQVQNCHRKKCTPVPLRPWWRVTITLNDEPEALRVLPPFDEHVADKIILLRASKFELPMKTDTTEGQERFWNTLTSEIPAFLQWLLNEYEIPEEMRDSRYVVKTFHHPHMLQELEELSPESLLLNLVDAALFELTSTAGWSGSANQLRADLINEPSTRRDAERLLDNPVTAGTYLGRLAKKQPGRVVKSRTSANTIWEISRPQCSHVTLDCN